MSNADFKTIIGFDKSNNATYDALRKRIVSFMFKNGIVNKTQAGDGKWQMLLDWVTVHPYMDIARQRIREESLDENTLHRAVHFLCLSCARNNGTGITSLDRANRRLEMQGGLID
jgi:hypothetical protein